MVYKNVHNIVVFLIYHLILLGLVLRLGNMFSWRVLLGRFLCIRIIWPGFLFMWRSWTGTLIMLRLESYSRIMIVCFHHLSWTPITAKNNPINN